MSPAPGHCKQGWVARKRKKAARDSAGTALNEQGHVGWRNVARSRTPQADLQAERQRSAGAAEILKDPSFYRWDAVTRNFVEAVDERTTALEMSLESTLVEGGHMMLLLVMMLKMITVMVT